MIQDFTQQPRFLIIQRNTCARGPERLNDWDQSWKFWIHLRWNCFRCLGFLLARNNQSLSNLLNGPLVMTNKSVLVEEDCQWGQTPHVSPLTDAINHQKDESFHHFHSYLPTYGVVGFTMSFFTDNNFVFKLCKNMIGVYILFSS